MTKQLVFLALALACARSYAAVPPPEKILPRETLLVATAPDASKYCASFNDSPYGRLWNDPSMKPFRDKLWSKVQSELIAPVEAQLGVKFSDYDGLARGQFTFALIRDNAANDVVPLLLIDSKDHADKLKTALADARSKWVAARKEIKTEQIHGIEFATFMATSGDLSNSLKNLFPDNKGQAAPAQEGEGTKINLLIGQSDSLLIVCNSKAVIEKVLALQSGGLASSLDQDPLFQADYAATLRDSLCWFWLNTKDIFAKIAAGDKSEQSNPANPSLSAIMAATGLSSLNSVAFAGVQSNDGMSSKLVLRVPESDRAGIFKAFLAGAKESSPPPFVPADVIQFVRWRIDMPEAWDSLEKLIGKVNPGAKDAINMILNSAGKARDDKYDFRAELLGSLGNDIIVYQTAPHGRTSAALASPPAILLVGSPKPESLTSALRVAAETFSTPVKESEFLGRKICFMGDADTKAGVSFAASGGYVAFSTDRTILEEYLRGADEKNKPLSAVAGLADAAQKVGGMNTGFFGYGNQLEQTRVSFENWRKNGLVTPKTAIPAGMGGPMANFNLSDWIDVSLLPPFESVAKYFSYSVFAGRSTSDSYEIKFFAPNKGN